MTVKQTSRQSDDEDQDNPYNRTGIRDDDDDDDEEDDDEDSDSDDSEEDTLRVAGHHTTAGYSTAMNSEL